MKLADIACSSSFSSYSSRTRRYDTDDSNITIERSCIVSLASATLKSQAEDIEDDSEDALAKTRDTQEGGDTYIHIKTYSYLNSTSTVLIHAYRIRTYAVIHENPIASHWAVGFSALRWDDAEFVRRQE